MVGHVAPITVIPHDAEATAFVTPRAFSASAVHIVTEPEAETSVEAVLRACLPPVRLLLLPNPGQPVETFFGADAIRRIARRCQLYGIVLVVDEAYFGFGAPTMLPLVDEFENLVVLRTFSKAFGGAALRVGYAVSQTPIASALNAVRQSGEISGPSLAAATVLMDRWDRDVAPGIRDVCAGRDWLRSRLRDRGLNAYGVRANHVLIDLETPARAAGVAARLRLGKVLVKSGFDAPLDHHLLVTCGSKALMERFYDELVRAL